MITTTRGRKLSSSISKNSLRSFFFEAYRVIDWSKGYIFLDKELRKITRKAEVSRKYVDKLVQVWLTSGDDVWAAVHVDVQSQNEDDFPKRMYVYNYRHPILL